MKKLQEIALRNMNQPFLNGREKSILRNIGDCLTSRMGTQEKYCAVKPISKYRYSLQKPIQKKHETDQNFIMQTTKTTLQYKKLLVTNAELVLSFTHSDRL